MLPTLVFDAQGKLISGLQSSAFRVTDDGRPQTFKLETESSPVSLVVAVQISSGVRAYLPAIAKVGSTLDNSLLGEGGEAAVIAYDNDVETTKPFGGGDLEAAIRKLKEGRDQARLIDAGLQAIDLLKTRPAERHKLLLLIGQPFDSGSRNKFEQLANAASRENITVFSLALPFFGKSFISDTFTLSGYGSQWYKGGYIATVEMTKLGPTLARSEKSEDKTDPMSLLAAETGGLCVHFRKQKDLENAIIATGAALRTTYLLTYSPDPLTSGPHHISVTTDVPGATAHARTSYDLELAK